MFQSFDPLTNLDGKVPTHRVQYFPNGAAGGPTTPAVNNGTMNAPSPHMAKSTPNAACPGDFDFQVELCCVLFVLFVVLYWWS